jgi:uncharacterized protein (DUF1800 family)
VLDDNELHIAHLYRRAGFGLPPEELKAQAKKGFAACVEELLHPEKIKDPLEDRLKEMVGEVFDLTVIEDAQAWWLYRMIHTQRALEEKMALFWHMHFATANGKVDRPAFMVKQNELFRQHALGKFGDLLLGIARDPAMLIWLDNTTSSKKQPNENFARELMELFTLGIGNYTEDDVRAVARAFTGWKQKDGEFSYDAKDHDDGSKTIFGQTWAWKGEEVVDLLARHPKTAERMAHKLVCFFVADEGSPELEHEIAETYLATGGDMREIVAKILRSPHFLDARAIRAKVKSPAEFAVGAIRELHATVPIRSLPSAVARMGQSLFNPPTVAGWDEGLSWINTATLFERANFANVLATQRGTAGDGRFDPAKWVPKDADGAAVVSVFGDALLDGRIPEPMRAALDEYLKGVDKDKKPVPFKATPAALDEKARGVVRLMLSSPEYQLA